MKIIYPTDQRRSDLFPLNTSRIARSCTSGRFRKIPWEHWDFTGRYYNPSLLRARAHVDKRGGVRQMTTGAVVAAAKGKQLRGGICRAYSNRRQIKSASVRRARCCGGISLFPSPHQLRAPRILNVGSREGHPLISVWRHRVHLETAIISKLLKAITVSPGTEKERERERE